MEEIKKTIRKIIENSTFEPISVYNTNNIKDIAISREKKFGMHIINSPRFICELYLIDENNRPNKIKIFIKNRPNVYQEFNNMKVLWDNHYHQVKKYIIPKPLYLDEGNSLLFMECYEGERFLNILYKSIPYRKNSFSRIEKCISDAALWLVDFQSIYIEENDSIPQEILSFEENIKGFVSLNEDDIKKIIDKINNVVRDIPKFCNTYVHDQYLFRNIIYYEERVCVVDFPHLRIGWPLYDLFTFYLGIERLQQYPFISKSYCAMMKELFISKYFEHSKFFFEKQVFDNLFSLFIIAFSRKRYKKFRNVRGYLNDKFVHQLSRRLLEWSDI